MLHTVPALGAPETPAIPETETPAPAPVKTKFRTPLRLTQEQEDRMLDETFMRLTELQREMGLTTWFDVIPGSWMWLRQCYDQYYHGDLSWRKALGGIFPFSNLTLGSGLRHVTYTSARVQDDLAGTEPFFACMGQTTEKEELAKQLEETLQGEIEVSGAAAAIREAQNIALFRNECVVMTGYVQDTTPFVGEATVLVDETGTPIRTPEKDLLIFEDDNFIPSPDTEGLMLLETDSSFAISQNPTPGMVTIPAQGDTPERVGTYQYFNEIEQVDVKREGVTCESVPFRSFLCPLKVRSLHDADTIAYVSLESPEWLQRVYGGIDVAQKYFDFLMGPDKPRPEQGEGEQTPTSIFQQSLIAQVYRMCDPDESGRHKDIFMVLDLTHRKIIYYNYRANHFKKRPFESMPGLQKVADRWYGVGVFGRLVDQLKYEDAQWNRAAYANSQAASINFYHPDAVEGWSAGIPPRVGTGEFFPISPNWIQEQGKEPIFRKTLAEPLVKENLDMMSLCRQSGDSIIGAISTQSANQSGFDQSKTAHGNQLVQQSADVTLKAIERDQGAAIQEILKQLITISLEHMDKTKLVFNKRTGALITLNRNECRAMFNPNNVRLLLTPARSTALLNNAGQALVIAKDYHATMKQDMPTVKVLRDQYISELKALQVADADVLCPEITDQMLQDWQAQQAEAAKAQAEPPSKSISTKYSDLARSEQEQVLSGEGITPAPREEIEAEKAKAQEAEAAQAEHNAALKPKPAPSHE